MKKTARKNKSGHNSRLKNFIKNHWFKTLMITIISLVAIFCLMIISSPREDAKRRGFIPCTENMIDELDSCQGNMFCSTKSILGNSYCNFKIIIKGFSMWVKKEQSTPWANYFFEPEIESPEDLAEFYQENPDVINEMQKLKKLNKELENGTDKEENK